MMMMITLTAHSVVSREENMWGILGLTPAARHFHFLLALPPTFTFFQPVLHIRLLSFYLSISRSVSLSVHHFHFSLSVTFPFFKHVCHFHRSNISVLTEKAKEGKFDFGQTKICLI